METTPIGFNAADPVGWKEEVLHSKMSESDKVGEAAKQFEAIMLRQFLSEAMGPVTKGAMGGNSSPIYGYLITDALASGMEQSQGLGISSIIQSQLMRHTPEQK